MGIKENQYRVTLLKVEKIKPDGTVEDFYEYGVNHNYNYGDVVQLYALVNMSNLEEVLVGAGLQRAKFEGFNIPEDALKAFQAEVEKQEREGRGR